MIIALASCTGTKETSKDTKTAIKNANQRNKPRVAYDMAIAEGKNAARVTGNISPGEPEKQRQYNREQYDKIPENKFLSPRSQPLSTFSIDVDRASYANMRRFLRNNRIPPPDAIRIEEMINYFDYDYPQPTGEHPFHIDMELGKSPWNTKHNLLKIGLQGKKISTENLPPSNLVFLLDVSGSMGSPNKLPLLKKAFRILLEKIRPEDKISVVVYAGASGVVLPSTPGSEKDSIRAALDKLNAGGSTAGGEGIKLAYKIAKKNFMENGNNRVILATDGDFNVGVSSDGALVRMIEKKRESGVYLTTLGFGTGNYQEAKMEKLSNAGNGNFAYIDNILEAKKVLGKEIWGTLYTIAKDVKIQVEFNPSNVKAYRLIGYANRMLEAEDFNDDTKDAGEVGSGHTVTALYEIIPPGTNEEIRSVDTLKYQQSQVVESDELLTFKLRYKEPADTVSKLLKKPLKTNITEKNQLSGNFRFASAVAEFGMLLRESELKGNSNYGHVIKEAQKVSNANNDDYKNEFIRLVKTAEALDEK